MKSHELKKQGQKQGRRGEGGQRAIKTKSKKEKCNKTLSQKAKRGGKNFDKKQ
jgi:hypothetical protein